MGEVGEISKSIFKAAIARYDVSAINTSPMTYFTLMFAVNMKNAYSYHLRFRHVVSFLNQRA